MHWLWHLCAPSHKVYLKDCHGGSLCEHQRLQTLCKDCMGNGICVHRRIKRNCNYCQNSDTELTDDSEVEALVPILHDLEEVEFLVPILHDI